MNVRQLRRRCFSGIWTVIACLLIIPSLYAQREVSTIEDLHAIREALDGEYILVNNIDMGDFRNWQPIGTEERPFTGVFDGGGYKILNMTIARWEESGIGFFGVVSGGTVKNLGMESRNIVGCTYVAGLVGYLRERGTVSECYSIANVSGNRAVGGLVGYVDGESRVINSYAGGVVVSEADAAGLVGMFNESTIINCYAFAEVEGFLQPGGLVGGRIQTGTTRDSFWDIEASGTEQSFGGRGLATAGMITRESYPDSWDFDEVWRMTEGVTYPYLAWQREPAAHNYPGSGGPSALNARPGDRQVFLSWLEPSTGLQVAFNIYRNDELLTTVDDDVLQYRDQQVQNYTNYTYFVTAVWEDETESRPSNSVTATPHEAFPGGSGTEDDPYELATARNLNDLRYQPAAHYILTADINLGTPPWNQERGWLPIGYYVTHTDNLIFTGRVDGNGHIISGLTISRNDQNYVGLFGYTDGAELINLTLEGVNVFGSNFVGGLVGWFVNSRIDGCRVAGEVRCQANYAGGLIGYMMSGEVTNSSTSGTVTSSNSRAGGLIADVMAGTVRNCKSSAEVTVANQFGGGLVAYFREGEIDYCFATGEVRGRIEIGGLIGHSRGILNNSFALGSVTGTGDYIGGLVGRNYGQISGCYSENDVVGVIFVGGIAGENNAPIINSYAAGTVTGSDNVTSTNIGGLVGRMVNNITNCYAVPRVTGAGAIGGLVGARTGGTTLNSYWDTQRTGQQNSPQGDGRTTEQMTYQYAANTYVNWDFVDFWGDDAERVINRGYPILRNVPTIVSPHPLPASNPQPQQQATNISAFLEELAWTYEADPLFTNPAGFRIYFNTTGQFGGNDDYVWVPYVEEQEQYATSAILPNRLLWNTIYYWKVVPTTIEPDDRRTRRNTQGIKEIRHSRGDAENVTVWRFTTSVSPNPQYAVNPHPAHQGTEISPGLEELSWTYNPHQSFINPLGFRIYFNNDGDFEEDDEFEWVPFVQNQTRYSASSLLPERLTHSTDYFWKVVPTTTVPTLRYSPPVNRTRASSYQQRQSFSSSRGDAEEVPVWSFRVRAVYPHPAIAINPTPGIAETGVSMVLRLGWQYVQHIDHANPAGFKIYMNLTGAFSPNAPFSWVAYNGEETAFNYLVAYELDANTTYYWRIVPTTKVAGQGEGDDAQNSPVWRFTTGTTDVGAIRELPVLTELHRNYPNPFNPHTTISFSLAEGGMVELEVFNAKGQQIIKLVAEYKDAGYHHVLWDGKDDTNRPVGSGVYFYRMRSGNYTETNKMIIMQ